MLLPWYYTPVQREQECIKPDASDRWSPNQEYQHCPEVTNHQKNRKCNWHCDIYGEYNIIYHVITWMSQFEPYFLILLNIRWVQFDDGLWRIFRQVPRVFTRCIHIWKHPLFDDVQWVRRPIYYAELVSYDGLRPKDSLASECNASRPCRSTTASTACYTPFAHFNLNWIQCIIITYKRRHKSTVLG